MKNATQLRNKLIELFNDLDSEDVNVHSAKEKNRAAANIISSARTELQYQVAKGQKPSIPFLES